MTRNFSPDDSTSDYYCYYKQFVIACEPALSTYKVWTAEIPFLSSFQPYILLSGELEQNAVDFYNALTQITSGRIFPLLMADKLGDYIVGSAVETIETEKLINEFEQIIVDDVYDKDLSLDTVASNLQDYIKSKGIQLNTVVVEDVYTPSATARSNVSAWASSPIVAAARERVREASIGVVKKKSSPLLMSCLI